MFLRKNKVLLIFSDASGDHGIGKNFEDLSYGESFMFLSLKLTKLHRFYCLLGRVWYMHVAMVTHVLQPIVYVANCKTPVS